MEDRAEAFVTSEIGKTADLLAAVLSDHGLVTETAQAAGLCAAALRRGGKILLAGNGYGFEEVFSRQVEALGSAGDVLIALSTSGRSKNIVKALAAACAKALATASLTGAAGGDMEALCDRCLRVQSRDTQKIQETHIALGHILCGPIERSLHPQT
jgi:D-sedoheptulose 7-phosphate isomerase